MPSTIACFCFHLFIMAMSGGCECLSYEHSHTIFFLLSSLILYRDKDGVLMSDDVSTDIISLNQKESLKKNSMKVSSDLIFLILRIVIRRR